MDSLVGYGSDDDNEMERFGSHSMVGPGTSSRRREDDTNYDDVNMDMSEDSESEPELPPAASASSLRRSSHSRQDQRGSDDSRDHDHRDKDRNRDSDRRDRRRDSPIRSRSDRVERERCDRDRGERDRNERVDRERNRDRSPRRDDRHNSKPDRGDRFERSDRADRSDRPRGHEVAPRRGLLGDRPDDRSADKVPALMDLKPFPGSPPGRTSDSRDAASPRFAERDRRDRDKERDRDRGRERDRDRQGRRSEERRGGGRQINRDRSRSRGAAFPPPNSHAIGNNERRGSPPSGEYRPSSYKVNKKLEVMEKMGLQIKTPDGSMATAQQLRAAAGDPPVTHSALPSYYNPSAVNTNKILDQVQKRKLLWSSKNKTEAEEAAKWSGTRFAQDSDGKQATKFMRLMGIKEPTALQPESTDKVADPIKKQEELFQAMQAQYEVARATTHTMRGVGLGFQRGQF